MTRSGPCCLSLSAPSLPSFLSMSQLYAPPSLTLIVLSTRLPQGLCTCCFLLRNVLPVNSHEAPSLRSLSNCPPLRRPPLGTLCQFILLPCFPFLSSVKSVCLFVCLWFSPYSGCLLIQTTLKLTVLEPRESFPLLVSVGQECRKVSAGCSGLGSLMRLKTDGGWGSWGLEQVGPALASLSFPVGSGLPQVG